MTLHLSPGLDVDISHAETLLGDHRPGAVLGDKGYDSDKLAAAIGDELVGGSGKRK